MAGKRLETHTHIKRESSTHRLEGKRRAAHGGGAGVQGGRADGPAQGPAASTRTLLPALRSGARRALSKQERGAHRCRVLGVQTRSISGAHTHTRARAHADVGEAGVTTGEPQ